MRLQLQQQDSGRKNQSNGKPTRVDFNFRGDVSQLD
jgi:hypothetical protein